jgi:hypothetical protein
MKNNFIIGLLCLSSMSISVISCGNRAGGHLDTTTSTNAAVSEATVSTAAAEDIDAATPNTMFVEEKNRVTEQHGTMQVETKDVSDYCKKLNLTVAKFKGHSTTFNIENKEEVVKQLPHTKDSVCNVTSTHQEARFEFRVAKKDAPHLVNDLLALDGKIIKLDLMEEDMTEDYRTSQIIDESSIASKEVADSLGIERTATNRAAKEEMKFRSQFLWCSVQVSSPEVIKHIVIANPQSTTASFGTELAERLRNGNSFMRELILVCFQIWPLILGVAALWFLVKKRRFFGTLKQ